MVDGKMNDTGMEGRNRSGGSRARPAFGREARPDRSPQHARGDELSHPLCIHQVTHRPNVMTARSVVQWPVQEHIVFRGQQLAPEAGRTKGIQRLLDPPPVTTDIR